MIILYIYLYILYIRIILYIYFYILYTPPARGDTFLLVVGDVILWVSNLATSAKSWGQIFNNS